MGRLACDDSGRAYLAGVLGAGQLWLDVHAPQAQPQPGSSSRARVRLSVPDPPAGGALRVVEHLCVSPWGTHAVLAGPAEQGGDRSALLLLTLGDLAAPLASSSGSGPQRPEAAEAVDAPFFEQHPGLGVLQVAWHPLSGGHFSALTSDGAWRLYSVQDLSAPEQEFGLRQGRTGSVGSALEPVPRPVAFAHGPHRAWGFLAVLFLFSDSALYALCPVLPFGARLSPALAQELRASAAAAAPPERGGSPADRSRQEHLRQWLAQAVPVAEGQGASGSATAQPHALEAAAPRLSGPLPVLPPPQGPPRSATPTSLAVVGKDLTVLAVGDAAGGAACYVLLDPVEPRFAPSQPRVAHTVQGSPAVRTRAAASPLAAPRLLSLGWHEAPASSAPHGGAGGPLQVSGGWGAAGQGPHLLCSGPTAAWSLHLAWHSPLLEGLCSGRAALSSLAALPAPSSEPLWPAGGSASGPGGRTERTDPLQGAALLRNAILGDSLVVALPTDELVCLRPAEPELSQGLSGEEEAEGGEVLQEQEAAERSSAQPLQLGWDFTAPYRSAAPVSRAAASSAVDSHQGLEALKAAARGLEAQQVESCTEACHALREGLSQTAQRHAELLRLAQHLSRLQAQLQARQQQLASRTGRAERLSSNFAARSRLLSGLRVSRQPAASGWSAKAKALLAPLESEGVEELARTVQEIKAQSAAAAASQPPSPSGAAAASPPLGTPPAQLRGVRGALVEQAALLGRATRVLSALEQTGQQAGQRRL